MCQLGSAGLNSLESLSHVSRQEVTGLCDSSRYRGPQHGSSHPNNELSLAPNCLAEDGKKCAHTSLKEKWRYYLKNDPGESRGRDSTSCSCSTVYSFLTTSTRSNRGTVNSFSTFMPVVQEKLNT